MLRINRIWYMNGIWPWHYSGFLSRICCFEWIVLLTIYILIYQRYWGVLLLGLVVFKSRFCAYSCRLITKICEWDEYHEFAFYVCNFWANDTNTYTYIFQNNKFQTVILRYLKCSYLIGSKGTKLTRKFMIFIPFTKFGNQSLILFK